MLNPIDYRLSLSALNRFVMGVILMVFMGNPLAYALEFRSIKEMGTIFYDAPSQGATKLFVVSQYYPVEVLNSQKDWSRVRDATGSIAWVPTSVLSQQAMLLVTVPEAEVREADNAHARILFRVAKNGVVQKSEAPRAGWVKIRHLDGGEGYIRITEIWGL